MNFVPICLYHSVVTKPDLINHYKISRAAEKKRLEDEEEAKKLKAEEELKAKLATEEAEKVAGALENIQLPPKEETDAKPLMNQ